MSSRRKQRRVTVLGVSIPVPVLAAVSAVVVLMVGLVVAFGPDGSSDVAEKKTPGTGQEPEPMRVQQPADGNLTVAGVEVAQLAGRCDDAGVCNYAYTSDNPVVKIGRHKESLPVKAKQSKTFSVSLFALGTTKTPKGTAVVADGKLLVGPLGPGKYRITLTGDAGGIWAFDLHRGRG